MSAPEHKELNFKEHARIRALWGGAATVGVHDLWVLGPNGQFAKKSVLYSDAMLNTIDEVIVNAVDHYVRSVGCSEAKGGPVRNIKVKFDRTTGRISVWNDGPGIPIIQKWSGQTKEGWLPEAIISHERMGQNFDDKKDPYRLTGGLNGLGLKIANVACDEFGVETVSLEHKKYYKQICRERMEYVDPPVVIDLPTVFTTSTLRAVGLNVDQAKSHTEFSLVPSYPVLNKKDKETPDSEWYSTGGMIIVEDLLRLRTYQIAAFTSSIKYKTVGEGERVEYNPVKIWFNGKPVEIGGLDDFMGMFGLTNRVCITLDGPFPWTVGVGLLSNMDRSQAADVKAAEAMSIINAIHVTQGGSHVNLMIGKILEGLQKFAGAEIPESLFRKIFCYFDVKQFPFCQLDFKSQTKEKIVIGRKDQNTLKTQYMIPDDTLKTIWKLAEKDIKMALERKQYIDQVKDAKSKRGGPIRKFDPPEIRGPKAGLFCAEGDTALQVVRDMIKMKGAPIDKRYYGTYSLQGVPPNAMKMSHIVPNEDGTGSLVIADYQLQQNITFNGLVRATGLDFEARYEPGKTGDAEFKRLNVGRIILATDQDVDGVGNICTMVIIFIARFWGRALFDRGFVCRFESPLVRVYTSAGAAPADRKKVFQFYSEHEYETWATARWGSVKAPKGYRVEYYKGLGGHTKEEERNMSATLLDNIYTMTWDDSCEHLFKVMYEEDTAERKVMLMQPRGEETYPSEVRETHKIPLSAHLMIEAMRFKLAGMRRKTRNFIDGFIPTQRKIFWGSRKMFGPGAKASKAKVFQITGYVAKEAHYGQGDMSINDALKKMAQTFEGACNIPPMVPISVGFGDVPEGRAVSGGARYLDTKYNGRVMDHMFPRVDDWLLEYNVEDGDQVEPKHYVPIMPYSILETENTTGQGWNINLYGRDFGWTLTQVRRLINGETALSLFGHPWFKSEGLSCRIEKGVEISYGNYTYYPEQNMFHITQLPYKVWSYPWKCAMEGVSPATGKSEVVNKETGEVRMLKKKPYVKMIKDDSANGKYDIRVWLEDGAYEKILAEYGNANTDPCEDFLDLRSPLSVNLNMINQDGYIREFKDYLEVVLVWFEIRRDLYCARLERMRILLEYRIRFYKEMLRFILMDGSSPKEINIDKDFTEEERDAILSEASFTRFNKSCLMSPGYLKVSELYDAIFVNDATYTWVSDITIGEKSKSSVHTLRKKIETLEAEYAELLKSTWQSLWLDELAGLEKAVKRGLETDWQYETETHVFV
jgi:DNA topoisomerase-2